MHSIPPTTPGDEQPDDARFTMGLVSDVLAVVEAHGYRRPTDDEAANRATALAVVALIGLVRAYEGREA